MACDKFNFLCLDCGKCKQRVTYQRKWKETEGLSLTHELIIILEEEFKEPFVLDITIAISEIAGKSRS